MSGRSIEFVMNREQFGCFGADVEALTGVDQDEINGALAASDLYDSDRGLYYTHSHALNDSMRKGFIPVEFRAELPFYEGFGSGDLAATDESPHMAHERLETLQEVLLEEDHEGLILLYPCQRSEGQEPFPHYVAAIEPKDPDAALTVMDPSELPGHGGVFQKSEDEALAMLTPNAGMDIPILAYSVRKIELPEDDPHAEVEGAAAAIAMEHTLEEELEPGAELERTLVTASISEPYIL